jgi:hypothetical protein
VLSSTVTSFVGLEREAAIGTQPDTLQLTHHTLVVTLRGNPAQISLLDTRSFAVRQVNIPRAFDHR